MIMCYLGYANGILAILQCIGSNEKFCIPRIAYPSIGFHKLDPSLHPPIHNKGLMDTLMIRGHDVTPCTQTWYFSTTESYSPGHNTQR